MVMLWISLLDSVTIVKKRSFLKRVGMDRCFARYLNSTRKVELTYVN